MCSEFFRIPLQIGGVPLAGFGILFWGWLAIAGWGILQQARRDGWAASCSSQLPMTIIGAAVIWFLPRYFPEGLPVRGYGLMVLAGSVLGIAMALHRAREQGVSEEAIMQLALALFVGGIVGARLFYIIEYWDSRIAQRTVDGSLNWPATLKEALSYTEGGLVVYGAFLGGMAAFFGFVHRKGLPGWALADLIAPSLLAGLAVGRIGCLLNGCCYGGETELPWAVTFPRYNAPETLSMPYRDQAAGGRFQGLRLATTAAGPRRLRIASVEPDSPAAAAGLAPGQEIVAINGYETRSEAYAGQILLQASLGGTPLELTLADGRLVTIEGVPPPPRSRPVHPTQVYSTINASLLAWVLWSYYPIRRRDGEVVALMLMLYPIARFLLEIIRIDEAAVFGTGLSISQNISLVLFAAAIAFWIWLRTSPARKPAFAAS